MLREHLEAVHAMPRLRRLDVHSDVLRPPDLPVLPPLDVHRDVLHPPDVPAPPPLDVHGDVLRPADLPALPPPRPGHAAGVHFLRVWFLPRDTLVSLLRAHAHSLRTLWLVAGTAGGMGWPRSCGDLPALLAGCGLSRLERLVLVRYWAGGCSHSRIACQAQRADLRGALRLPAGAVLCHEAECNRVEWDNF